MNVCVCVCVCVCIVDLVKRKQMLPVLTLLQRAGSLSGSREAAGLAAVTEKWVNAVSPT